MIWPTVSRMPNVFSFSEAWLLGGLVAVGAVLFLTASFMLRFVRGPEPAEAIEGQEKRPERRDMNDIVIVDYGMANLRSVQKAFEKVGHAA